MPFDLDRLKNIRTDRRALGIGAAGAVVSIGGIALVTSKVGGSNAAPEATQPALAVQDEVTTEPAAAAGFAGARHGRAPTLRRIGDIEDVQPAGHVC